MTSCFLALCLLSGFRSAPSNAFEDLDWLDELHDKLWGRADLFHQVFCAVDLTKDDFVELRSELHHLNPSRNRKSYTAKEVLETKVNSLRSRTATRPLTVATDSLVPKVVLQASEGLIPTYNVKIMRPTDNVKINSKKNIKRQRDDKGKEIDDENAKGDVDGEDSKGDENDQHSESEDVDDDDKSYIDEDAAVRPYFHMCPIQFYLAPFGTWI